MFVVGYNWSTLSFGILTLDQLPQVVLFFYLTLNTLLGRIMDTGTGSHSIPNTSK